MARNFKFSGKRVTIAVEADVTSGKPARQRGFIGIPLNHTLSGASVPFALEGVWGLTWDFYATSQPAVGTILYWDTTTGLLSLGAANDDYPIVKVVEAVSSANGSFLGLLLPQGRPYGQEQ